MTLPRPTPCAVLRNVYLGLAVICAECRGLFTEGAARTLARAFARRAGALRDDLARLTVMADPARERVERELAFIEAERARLQHRLDAARAARLAGLRERFARDLNA